ncbi:MAG TPA: winged helix-turn-helix domain-containing protein [Nitrososphaerales archaeon]|nr:winged helix-turn-helix domain-containing protein [Nitrososphaerales archaeon]
MPALVSEIQGYRAKAFFLILLLLASGLSAPTASSFQRLEFSQNFFQLNSPVTFPSGSSGGGTFFFNIGVSTVGDTVNTPSFSTTGSSANYIYVRQGNVYNVFPESILENGSGTYGVIVFSPLLSVWLDSERRRSRFRIYVEILDLLRKGPMTPYEVSFHLRLNSKRTRDFMAFLAEKKFLQFSDQEGRLLCTITPPGAIFVENLRAILDQSE